MVPIKLEMSNNNSKWFSLNFSTKKKEATGSCGCGKESGGCGSHTKNIEEEKKKDGFDQVFDVKMSRRTAFKQLTASLMIGAGAVSSS